MVMVLYYANILPLYHVKTLNVTKVLQDITNFLFLLSQKNITILWLFISFFLNFCYENVRLLINKQSLFVKTLTKLRLLINKQFREIVIFLTSRLCESINMPVKFLTIFRPAVGRSWKWWNFNVFYLFFCAFLNFSFLLQKQVFCYKSITNTDFLFTCNSFVINSVIFIKTRKPL